MNSSVYDTKSIGKLEKIDQKINHRTISQYSISSINSLSQKYNYLNSFTLQDTKNSNSQLKNLNSLKDLKKNVVESVNKLSLKNMKKFEKNGIFPVEINKLRRDSLTEVIMSKK